jgi:hypothetical protein
VLSNLGEAARSPGIFFQNPQPEPEIAVIAHAAKAQPIPEQLSAPELAQAAGAVLTQQEAVVIDHHTIADVHHANMLDRHGRLSKQSRNRAAGEAITLSLREVGIPLSQTRIRTINDGVQFLSGSLTSKRQTIRYAATSALNSVSATAVWYGHYGWAEDLMTHTLDTGKGEQDEQVRNQQGLGLAIRGYARMMQGNRETAANDFEIVEKVLAEAGTDNPSLRVDTQILHVQLLRYLANYNRMNGNYAEEHDLARIAIRMLGNTALLGKISNTTIRDLLSSLPTRAGAADRKKAFEHRMPERTILKMDAIAAARSVKRRELARLYGGRSKSPRRARRPR